MDKKQRLEEAIKLAKQGSIAYLIGFGVGLIPVIGVLGLIAHIISIVKFYKAFTIFSEVWEEPKLITYFRNAIIAGIGGTIAGVAVIGIGVSLEEDSAFVIGGIIVIAAVIYALIMYVKLIRIFEEFTGHQLFKIARILYYTFILAGIGGLLFNVAFMTEEVQDLLRKTLVEVPAEEDPAIKDPINIEE